MNNINWNELWQQARRKRTWQGKSKADWNRRAAGFARRNAPSPYVVDFIGRLELDAEMTVLDFGAGPGTLAIPLAEKVRKVTAVDFSSDMLDILKRRAVKQGIDNIEVVEGAWESDWQALGLTRHDLIIASRSLAVDDLRAALTKLNDWADKRVVISDRVGSGPFDPELFRAIGRDFVAGPDYIYTLNILYQMGIYAQVDFIEIKQPKFYKTKDEAIDSCIWMLDEMSPEEKDKFSSYMDLHLLQNGDGRWAFDSQLQPKWAIIQWETV